MNLSPHQVLGLPVETKSGTRLGIIVDFEIDSDQQVVARYMVKPAFVPRVLARELIIGASQVVSITNKKMVVEDGSVVNEEAVSSSTISATSP